MGQQPNRMVPVGRISGLHGIKGWVRVYSFTEPRENIVGYRPWYLKRAGRWQAAHVEAGGRHGKGVIAKLAGCDDRDDAAALVGLEIGVSREQFPVSESGEYYWADLLGLQVLTRDGVDLGRVDHLIETGANDVLVVKGDRERLIPFLTGSVIRSVDLERGRIDVDWDPHF